jgi:hypothetical protein
LSYDDNQRDDGDREPVLYKQGWVYHHADRDKKDCAKDVFDGLYEVLNSLGFNGFG